MITNIGFSLLYFYVMHKEFVILYTSIPVIGPPPPYLPYNIFFPFIFIQLIFLVFVFLKYFWLLFVSIIVLELFGTQPNDYTPKIRLDDGRRLNTMSHVHELSITSNFSVDLNERMNRHRCYKNQTNIE